jgi:hypothetical protein
VGKRGSGLYWESVNRVGHNKEVRGDGHSTGVNVAGCRMGFRSFSVL